MSSCIFYCRELQSQSHVVLALHHITLKNPNPKKRDDDGKEGGRTFRLSSEKNRGESHLGFRTRGVSLALLFKHHINFTFLVKIHFSTFLLRVYFWYLCRTTRISGSSQYTYPKYPVDLSPMDTEGDKHMTFFNCKNGKNFESFFFHQNFFLRKEKFVSVSKKQKKQES